MNPTELFPSPFPSLFRGVGLLSSSRYKIVALKSAWTTLKHPEWIDISVLTTLHQNTTETIFFCTVTLDPFPDFHTILHSGQRSTCVPSKQELLSEAMSVQVEAIPSLCLQPAPCCSPCSVELCCPVKLIPTARLPITGPTGICYMLTKQTDCSNSYLHVAFLSLVQRRTGCEKHRGVHRERQESLFFTANFKENFSTVCMRDFFFLKKICTRGDKPKCTVP